jgi:hypothetical protein
MAAFHRSGLMDFLKIRTFQDETLISIALRVGGEFRVGVELHRSKRKYVIIGLKGSVCMMISVSFCIHGAQGAVFHC